jgi:hypothetical protein
VRDVQVFNTAWLSGVDVTTNINTKGIFDSYFTPDVVVTPNTCEYLNISTGVVYERFRTVYTLVPTFFYGLGDVPQNVSSIEVTTFTDPNEDWRLIDRAIVGDVCQLSLTTAHEYGKGNIHFRVGYDHTEPTTGVTSNYLYNVTVRVWYPWERFTQMSDYYFDAIAGAKNPNDCSSKLYQSAAVTASATW